MADELQVHRADGQLILLDDRLGRTAARRVALQAADEANVGIGVHEELDVEQVAQGWLHEDQDALHHDDAVGATVKVWSVRL